MKVRIEYGGKVYEGNAWPTHRGGNPVCMVAADGIHGPEMGAGLEYYDRLERGDVVTLPCGMIVTPAPAGIRRYLESEIGSNPRYAAYAQAHGRTPDEMMEHDRAAWPGGCMCGFIVWMSEQTQAFWKACQNAFLDRYTIQDQGAWTAFLQSVATAAPHGRDERSVP